MKPPLPALLDAETLDRRRRASGWTCRHEPASIPGMTLIIAAHASTGEVVVAADRRVSGLNQEGDGVIISSNESEKLIDFDGRAVIGIAGKNCSLALRVARDFAATEKCNEQSCDRLAKLLAAAYREWHGDDCKEWPITHVTYCDWHNRGRILLLRSRINFVPGEPGVEPHLSGSIEVAMTFFNLFGLGSRSVAHLERYCLLSLALTAQIDGSVGESLDLWLLSPAGIVKRTGTEMETTLGAINESLNGLRGRLYP